MKSVFFALLITSFTLSFASADPHFRYDDAKQTLQFRLVDNAGWVDFDPALIAKWGKNSNKRKQGLLQELEQFLGDHYSVIQALPKPVTLDAIVQYEKNRASAEASQAADESLPIVLSPASSEGSPDGSQELNELLEGIQDNLHDKPALGFVRKYSCNGNTIRIGNDGGIHYRDHQGNKKRLTLIKPDKRYQLVDRWQVQFNYRAALKGCGIHFVQMLSDLDVQLRRLAILKAKKQKRNYYFLAKETLGEHWNERLLAMEKGQYPLSFLDEGKYNEFKTELASLLKRIDQGNGHFSIIGSSTTFFSHTPTKGSTQDVLKLASPGYHVSNNDNIYFFDKSGPGASDLDIHLYIPVLSHWCHEMGARGNNGIRTVYYDIDTVQCFNHSANSDSKLKTDLEEFRTHWGSVLGREVSFSVHITPDIFKGSKPGASADFSEDDGLNTLFTYSL